MSNLDRTFAQMRANAMRKPLTRANTFVIPEAELPHGVFVGLSLNK